MERLGNTPMLIATTPSVTADRHFMQTVSPIFSSFYMLFAPAVVCKLSHLL